MLFLRFCQPYFFKPERTVTDGQFLEWTISRHGAAGREYSPEGHPKQGAGPEGRDTAQERGDGTQEDDAHSGDTTEQSCALAEDLGRDGYAGRHRAGAGKWNGPTGCSGYAFVVGRPGGRYGHGDRCDYFRDKGLSPEGVREAQPHFIGRLTAAGRESQQRGMSLEALQRKNRMDELELQKEEASWIERSVEVTDENGLPANDANGKPIRRPLTAEELRRLDVDKNWKFDSTNLAWINSLTQDVVPLSSELYKFIRDRRLAAKGKAPMSEATISDIANTTSLMHQARVLRSMLYGTRIGLDGKERSGTKFTLENAKILRDFLGGGVWGEIKRKFTTARCH